MTVRQDYVRAERERFTSEMRALAEKDGGKLSADDQERFDYLDARVKTLQAEEELLARPDAEHILAARGGARPQPVEPIGQSVTIPAGRSIREWCEREHSNRWTKLDFEIEQKLGPAGWLRAWWNGPKNDLERRALGEASDAAGGAAVPEIVSSVLYDLMREKSLLNRLGVPVVLMETPGDIHHFAKLATWPDASWVAENIQFSTTDATFSRVSFTHKKCVALIKASKELLADAPNMGTMIVDTLTKSFAEELDKVLITGTTAGGGPEGILSWATTDLAGYHALTSSTTAYPARAAGYSPWLTAYANIMAYKDEPTGVVMAARDWCDLQKGTATDGQPLVMPSLLQKLNWVGTVSMPTTYAVSSTGLESKAIMANFSRTTIGMRLPFEVQRLTERFSDYYQTAWLAAMRMDHQGFYKRSFDVVHSISSTGST